MIRSSFAGERGALSQWPDIGDLFQDFAEHLIDGNIKGSAGKKYTLARLPIDVPMEVDAEWPTIGFSVTPFTVKRSLLRFKPGTRATLTATGSMDDKKVKISYSPSGKEQWAPLKKGLPLSIDVPCDGKAETYDLVYTSTLDSDGSENFELKIARGEQKACHCKITAVPLDPCLVGDWTLDDELMAQWLPKFYPAGRNYKATGVYDIKFQKDHQAFARFDQFRVSFDMVDGNKTAVWAQTVDGKAAMQVIVEKPGVLCIETKSISGTHKLELGTDVANSTLSDIFSGGGAGAARGSYSCKAKQMRFWIKGSDGKEFLDWNFAKP